MAAGLVGGVSSSATANPGPDPGRRSEPAGKLGAGGIFGSLEIKTNKNAGSRKWQDVLRRTVADIAKLERCSSNGARCGAAAKAWQAMIADAGRQGSLIARMDAINRTVNRLIRYRDDAVIFGTADYWASPLQTIGRRGDCEDYVIAKYAALRQLGLPSSRMRLVVVKDTSRGLGHAVLAVRHRGRTYILDNLASRLRTHEQIAHYRPAYSISEAGAWLNIPVKIRATQQMAEASPALEPASQSETRRLDPPLPEAKPAVSLRGPHYDDGIGDVILDGDAVRLISVFRGTAPGTARPSPAPSI